MAGALVAYVVALSAGAKNVALADFLPRWGQTDHREPASADALIRQFETLVGIQKKEPA